MNDQLTVIDAVRKSDGSSVHAILDPICYGRFARGTQLKDISFKYAGGNFYCCLHVSYQTYQCNDTVFFNGQASPTCPIHPWSRPIWLTWSVIAANSVCFPHTQSIFDSYVRDLCRWEWCIWIYTYNNCTSIYVFIICTITYLFLYATTNISG